jgi:carbamoyltransferase
MRILGINCLGHDASMSVTDGQEILWSAHAERYSKIKNDPYLNQEIVKEAMVYSPFDLVVYYENPWLKKTRQLKAGQLNRVFNKNDIPSSYLKKFGIKIDQYANHHESHVAGAYYTSPFINSTILCMDAIGEWDTISIWDGVKGTLKKRESFKYPHSLGLLYSAFTQRVGLKPNEEEYILMGMSAYGNPIYKEKIYSDFIKSVYPFRLNLNVHKGIGDWMEGANNMDLAASIQKVTEECMEVYWRKCKNNCNIFTDQHICYTGGIALNCVANSLLANTDEFRHVWVHPNPGDAGSSLGSIASIIGHLNWKNSFLGHDIKGEYPVDDIIKELETNKIVGVAKGRAEFGARALGNRSLLADPRDPNVKDIVNQIKRRQMFRPFAPAILEEDLHDYFEVPRNVESFSYMQFTGICKDIKKFFSIAHHDGTSRIQTVNEKENPDFYRLLKLWKEKTGCPMLLNTSLNIKGEPMVNDENDAKRFQEKYKVKVF